MIARTFSPVETGGGQHPLTTIWMPYAVADPLLYRATLNFAAAHLDIMHGRQCSPRTMEQKGQIIELVKLRLQDPAEALSNPTIGAVAMLAAMEVCGLNLMTLSNLSTSHHVLQVWTVPNILSPSFQIDDIMQ